MMWTVVYKKSVQRDLKGLSEDIKYIIKRAIEEKLMTYKDIANFSTEIGAASPNSGSFGAGAGSASNLASISIIMKDGHALKSYDFADKLRDDLASTTGMTVRRKRKNVQPRTTLPRCRRPARFWNCLPRFLTCVIPLRMSRTRGVAMLILLVCRFDGRLNCLPLK